MPFEGITADSLYLLAENRFNDSKAFYEEHKPAIKRGVIEPLRCLVAELMPSMLAVDPLIGGSVSRVRRDNRFTKDKLMYRENMWIVFMRDKRTWNWCVPAFYLDFSLNGAEWGMGFYGATPSMMKALRRRAEADPERVIKAIRKATRAGFVLAGEPYARPRSTEDTPKEMRPLYDCRNLYFSRTDGTDFVADTALPEVLRRGFAACVPMYAILMEAVEEIVGMRDDLHVE